MVSNYRGVLKSKFFYRFHPRNYKMPQVDKVTFLPIVFWAFVIYLGGFLFLNSGALYTFLSSMKIATKYSLAKIVTVLTTRRGLFAIAFFPLLAL